VTWLAIGGGLAAFVLGYLLGAVHAHEIAMRAWQRHERVHGRGWPPMPRPFPQPPAPPPDPRADVT
jgi:hypothetical protein